MGFWTAVPKNFLQPFTASPPEVCKPGPLVRTYMAAEFQCEAAAIPALLANVASISSGGGEPALTDTRRQRGPAAYDSRCTAGAGCDLSPEVAARPLGHQARSDVTGV